MSDLSLTGAGRIDSDLSQRDRRLAQATKQFETVFIKQLLDRDLPYADDPRSRLVEEGPGLRNARELLHQALGETMAGGFGLADAMLARRQALGGGETDV